MKETRIRSQIHRRILTWLAAGPATISEIANIFDLKMPHASLACKQLREQGFISRNRSSGIRNVELHLTNLGAERLRLNSLAHLKEYQGEFPLNGRVLVLAVEDEEVLLCYAQQPQSSLQFISKSSILGDQDSNGNHRGALIHCPINTLEWYDTESFEPTLSPLSSTQGTLDAFSHTPSVVCIVRCSVIETTHDGILFAGEHYEFGTPETFEPNKLSLGDVPIGKIEGTPWYLSIPQGSNARLPSRGDRLLLLEQFQETTMVFDCSSDSSRCTLDVNILRTWLTLKHPRMSQSSLEQKFEQVREAALSTTSTHASKIQRELVSEFKGITWEEGVEMKCGLYHLSGLTEDSMNALVLYCLASSPHPFCLDWKFSTDHRDLFHRLQNEPLCQLIISRGSEMISSSLPAPILTSSSELGFLYYALRRGTLIRLEITDPPRQFGAVMIVDWPSSAFEFKEVVARFGNRVMFKGIPPSEQSEHIATACLHFPEGDETIANKFESTSPIAAWIASPQEFRPSRWQRTFKQLPYEWVELMPMQELDLVDAVHSLEYGGEQWVNQVMARIQRELPRQPQSILELKSKIKTHQFACVALLYGLENVKHAHQDIIQNAFAQWTSNPLLARFILMRWTYESQVENATAINNLLKFALTSQDYFFQTWGLALENELENRPWPVSLIRRCIEQLPLKWWCHHASEWLQILLSSSSGRDWVSEHYIAWPAALFRARGERVGLPGRLRHYTPFEGLNDNLHTIPLLEKGKGWSVLNEVYHMVTSDQTVSPIEYECHPLAGWLSRDIALWPEMDEAIFDIGDRQIAGVLYGRKFASALQD